MWENVLGSVAGWLPQLTSGDMVLLLLQLEKLQVQLIVFPDQPSILCLIWLQKSIKVLAFFLSLPC